MAMCQAITIESIVNNWNEYFSTSTLKPDDLKKPHSLMNAMFQIFDKLGIDREYVLAAPSEEESNESTPYYRDLLPVINMTRVVTHLVSVMPEVIPSMMHFLQPTLTTSRSIVVVLFNLMLFVEERVSELRPHEQELFAKTEQVEALESRKHQLLGMLNKQAEEKGSRAVRLEKLALEVKSLEDELNQEKQLLSEEKLTVEQLTKSNHQKEMLLEQKKVQHEGLLAEVARKKALRVYDADDVKAMVEQATMNVQEAEEKLTLLRETLMKKENNLKSLQAIQPSLDTANGLLKETTKLTLSIKDYEIGDLNEGDSIEGELNVLNMEISELDAALSELRATRAELDEKHRESQASRHNDTSHALSALRQAEEEDKKRRAQYKHASQRIAEVKELTAVYEEQKADGLNQLAKIEHGFTDEMLRMDEAMINKMSAAENKVKNILKLQQRP